MSDAVIASCAPGSWRRWFTFLGGGIAWTLHLLAIYAIGEFGCVSGFDKTMVLGISAVAWLLILVSVVLLAVAISAALIGYQDASLDARRPAQVPADEGSRYLSGFGWWLDLLFALIILVESLPVFAYLDGC